MQWRPLQLGKSILNAKMEHNQNSLDSGGQTGEKHISGEHAWWETSDSLHRLLGGCTRHTITSVYEKPWPVYRFLPCTWHWQSQPCVVQLIQQAIRPLSTKLSSLKVICGKILQSHRYRFPRVDCCLDLIYSARDLKSKGSLTLSSTHLMGLPRGCNLHLVTKK